MAKKKRPGAYFVCNLMNLKCYFGHCSDLFTRPLSHLSALRGDAHINRQMARDYQKYGESAFISFPIAPTANTDEAKHIENCLIKIFRTTDSRFGYNQMVDGKWSPEARVRDTERKLIRSREGPKYVLLSGVDLNDQISHEFVRSVMKGHHGIDIDDPAAAYEQLSSVPFSIIHIVLLVLVILSIAAFLH